MLSQEPSVSHRDCQWRPDSRAVGFTRRASIRISRGGDVTPSNLGKWDSRIAILSFRYSSPQACVSTLQQGIVVCLLLVWVTGLDCSVDPSSKQRAKCPNNTAVDNGFQTRALHQIHSFFGQHCMLFVWQDWMPFYDQIEYRAGLCSPG